MRRFKFGRRRNSFRRFSRARKIVRAVQGQILAKRIILNESIPDVTSVDYDNPLKVDLLQCLEAQDEELESDGSNIATAPMYSRIMAMRLNLTVVGPASSTVAHRWNLYKKPDGEDLMTSYTDSGFHVSDDTQNQRELRKMTLAKGMLFTNSSTGVTPLRVFVKRKAWHRASPLRENDKITFGIAKDATGIASTLHGFGTIWVRTV